MGRKKLTEAEWSEVFQLRCISKSGSRALTREEQRLVDRAMSEDERRYVAMDADVFNATVPFGSMRRWPGT